MQAKKAGERRVQESELVVLNRRGLGYRQTSKAGIPKDGPGPSDAELHKIMEKAKKDAQRRTGKTEKLLLDRVGRGHRFRKSKHGKISHSSKADTYRRHAAAEATHKLAEERVLQLERKLKEEQKEKEFQDNVVAKVEEDLAKAQEELAKVEKDFAKANEEFAKARKQDDEGED